MESDGANPEGRFSGNSGAHWLQTHQLQQPHAARAQTAPGLRLHCNPHIILCPAHPALAAADTFTLNYAEGVTRTGTRQEQRSWKQGAWIFRDGHVSNTVGCAEEFLISSTSPPTCTFHRPQTSSHLCPIPTLLQLLPLPTQHPALPPRLCGTSGEPTQSKTKSNPIPFQGPILAVGTSVQQQNKNVS